MISVITWQKCKQNIHTDLYFSKLPHSSKSGEFTTIIAFIDDGSRMIMLCKIIPDKSSIITTNALMEAFELWRPPNKIVCDNGREFISENFQRKLKETGVKLWKTIILSKMGKLNDFVKL